MDTWPARLLFLIHDSKHEGQVQISLEKMMRKMFSLKISGFGDHRPNRNRQFHILLNFYSCFLLNVQMFPSISFITLLPRLEAQGIKP
ncbi:unnamed protein product [Boreogadus saida]